MSLCSANVCFWDEADMTIARGMAVGWALNFDPMAQAAAQASKNGYLDTALGRAQNSLGGCFVHEFQIYSSRSGGRVKYVWGVFNNRVVVIAPDGRQKITALNSRSPLSLARALAEELEDNVDRGR